MALLDCYSLQNRLESGGEAKVTARATSCQLKHGELKEGQQLFLRNMSREAVTVTVTAT